MFKFMGIPVLVSDFAETIERKQVKYPRSKKRRIQNKWAKQDKNFQVKHIPGMWKTPQGFICHPTIYTALVAKIAEINRALEVTIK